MSKPSLLSALAGAVLILSFTTALPAAEVYGPMPGYLAMRQATLWIGLSRPGRVEIEYWPAGEPTKARASSAVDVEASHALASTHLTIDGLTPGTTYAYRVVVDGVAADLGPLAFETLAQWRFRGPPPEFTVATGSCHYVNDPATDRAGQTGDRAYGQGFSILDRIAERAPDLMLWLGDNVYLRGPDFYHPREFGRRYADVRRDPAIQALMKATHHVATWDDHDYGPNNANGSWILKGDALAEFERHWANPSYGLPELPGVFTAFNIGDADFFLLDDRTYRDHDGAPDGPDKALFGDAQMDWLEQALLASVARFKVVVAGGEFFNDTNAHEGWNHFPDERGRFLEFLKKTRIEGLVFVSGDRHFGKLARVPRPGAYPLYELTCSPLTAGPYTDPALARNATVVDGTVVNARHFCLMAFTGEGDTRALTLSGHGTDGRERWSYRIPADELTYPAEAIAAEGPSVPSARLD